MRYQRQRNLVAHESPNGCRQHDFVMSKYCSGCCTALHAVRWPCSEVVNADAGPAKRLFIVVFIVLTQRPHRQHRAGGSSNGARAP